MTTARLFAVVTILMGSAFGLAGPVHADQVIQGIYGYDQGDVHAEWTIYPSCVPTVGDLRDNLELPVACRLHVAPSAAKVSGGDTRLTGGQWMFSTKIKDGMTCPDGSTAPIQETYEFDDVALTGTRAVSSSNVCNGQVAANPLYCAPGGLKQCF